MLLLSCAQLACAASIIVITALKLHNVKVTWDGKTWNADVSNTCLLGMMSNGANLCYLAYAVGGISVLATLALSLLQCCTCRLCGLGSILDAVFAAAGTVLWAASGVIFDRQYKQQQATEPNVPNQQWRFSMTVVSFAACALFGLMALAAVWSMLSACCCGGCCGGGTRTKTVYRDVEKGQSQFMVR